jgi:hypothetical protein
MTDRLARALAGAPLGNYNAANRALFMSPQEQSLYQRHLTNLWGNGGVDNPDGSRSTLYQVGFTGPDNRQYNVPSVYDGQILSPDAAIARAQQSGLQQFPSYATPEQAEARYQAMHGYMDRDTTAYMGVRNAPLYPTLADDSPQNAALAAMLAKVPR